MPCSRNVKSSHGAFLLAQQITEVLSGAAVVYLLEENRWNDPVVCQGLAGEIPGP